jgi:RNA-directed DNA polymerase
VKSRMQECLLEIHPDKTIIVYCKDANRNDDNDSDNSFDFLGYTFQPRSCRNMWGKLFVNFTPAMSKKAVKRIMGEIREWRLHKRMSSNIEDLARFINPKIRGWVNHYGMFNRSALLQIMSYIEYKLADWARRKYKRLKTRLRKAKRWLRRIKSRQHNAPFEHWKFCQTVK